MPLILEILVAGAALLLLLPVIVLFVEIVSAATDTAIEVDEGGKRPRLAVLMPAHNESLLISATLHSIKPQLADSDRLLVVADNCTDDTAAVATAAGAEAIARTDLAQRGKGFALDFGVRHLGLDAPEIVIIIDADCIVAPGTIDRLARACDLSARPVQAMYVMRAAANAGIRMRIAEFAWVIKNLVRPAGLHRLGLPCHLMGSGMAFPWDRIRSATLATGSIVEDLKLGIELARVGAPPLYCPAALVTSEFPASTEGAKGQRTRWEHGHLNVILNEAPHMFLDSLTRLDGRLLALALDLTVPPLALLTLLVMAAWIASCALFLATKLLFPVVVTSIAAGLLVFSIFLSWARFGRQVISFGKLLYAGVYAFVKLPLYARFLVTRQTAWVRSKRDKES